MRAVRRIAGELRGGGRGEQQDSDEGERGAEIGVPAGRARAGRAQAGDGGEERHQDDDQAGDECGFRGRGADEADGLELVAGGEAEADQCAGGELPALNAAPGSADRRRQARRRPASCGRG